MNNITDFLSSITNYFSESAGFRKFFNSTSTSYDLFMVMLALIVFLMLIIYFLYPVILRKILDRKLIRFILFYKDITNQEKNFMFEIAKKNKITPEYNIFIMKNVFDKCIDSELKTLMLKRESETKIRNVLNIKENLLTKLFDRE